MNLLNQNIFVLTKDKFDLLNSDLEEVEKKHIHLFSAMQKLGVIIPAEINEIDEVKYRNRMAIFADRSFRLTINPTLECNFSCWYCYEKHPQGKMEQKISKAIEKLVENKLKQKDVSFLQLDWFGGEPLICFDDVIFPLSKAIQNLTKRHKIDFVNSMTTNGFLLNQEKVKQCDEIELKNFQITLDGNKKLHDKIRFTDGRKGSFDQIVENINLLGELDKVNIGLRINYTEKTLENIEEIIPLFSEKAKPKIEIFFQQVWQDAHKKHISADHIINKFRDAGYAIHEYRPNICGNVCYADKENQAVINYDGKVFKCTAREFTTYPEDGILLKDGTINWNIERLTKRLGNATFENKYCLNCNLLPVCFGPCSQKMFEFDNSEERFQQICLKGGVLELIEKAMNKFYNSINNK
jgi:uncharacterized protein